MPLPLPLLAANFKRSVGDVNAVEQPYKYNTLANTTPTATAAATAATPAYNSSSNTLPKTNGFAGTATATATAAPPPLATHIDKSGGQPVPAPRRTNSVPGEAGAAYNGAASRSSGDSASEAQVRGSVKWEEESVYS